MSIVQPIVVIGSGQAGVSFIREFRKLNTEQPLTLICADAGGFYSKPMLSNAFAKNMALERLLVQDAKTLAEKTNCDIMSHQKVTHIDPTSKSLTLQDQAGLEQTLGYHKLILALGASPITPPIARIQDTISINHLEEYRALRTRLDTLGTKARIAIIGAGLVGCELANDLRLGGFEITLIERESQLLPKLASPAAAKALQEVFEEIGITTMTNVSVESIEDQGSSVRTGSGDINAQIIISALGLAPNTELAKHAGLNINNGILCDKHLQTSDPHIYGLGDCAEVSGMVLPYILPIMEGAKALAASLNGAPTPVAYPCMPVAVKTTSYPLVIAPIMTQSPAIEMQETKTSTGVKALYYEGEQLVGFCLSGDAVGERQALAKLCSGAF